MNELEIQRTYQRQERGEKVKLIQEWLCLNGHGVKIDGDFGPATEAAVKQFQSRKALPVTGVVDLATFERLVDPIKAALQKISPNGRSLGELAVAYAQQHLRQHPIEVGGENRGPWVRLYMNGNEGQPWAWCAGFACYCLRQACETLGQTMPIDPSFSCDLLAAGARQRGRLLDGGSLSDRARIHPGSLFLLRRTSTDWVHAGIVVSAEPEFFRSIEGNTNDNGSREGYEVCTRTRSYKAADFVLI